jgi:hypothetical protein
VTFTVKQLAQRWQCDQRIILAAIRSGKLRAFPLVPGAKRVTWRIPKDAVLAYESANAPQVPERPRRRRRRPDVIEFF